MTILQVPAEISLKRVLLATDFSPASESAMRHGLSIARRYGATADIVHIVDSLGYRLTGGDVLAQAVDLAQRDLANFEASLLQKGLLRDVPHHMLAESCSGEVWEALCRLVRQYNVDLIVLGTHGHTGIKKFSLGSVAEQVFRHCPCPVLTVGPYVAPGILADGPPQHILFPTDFSPESLQALPFAISTARECEAELALLHVVQGMGEAKLDHNRIMEVIRNRLQSLIPNDVKLSHPPLYLIEEGEPALSILDSAAAHRIDLIVLGLRSPEGPNQGSVWRYAYEIVCQAQCPVLTLRSAQTGH